MTSRSITLLTLLAVAACGNDPAPIDESTAEAREKFPDLPALYGGEQGIYRGCGPNGGVCHNGNEFPNLDSLGSILDNMDQPCNKKRDNPETIHDLCERPGDLVEIGGREIEVAWAGLDETDPLARRWKLGLREPFEPLEDYEELAVRRGDVAVWHLGYYAAASEDPDDPTGTTIVLDPYPGDPDLDYAVILTDALKGAGTPVDPAAVRAGDPNRNGVYGAELGGSIIEPGEPANSYLMHRLTDPSAGPLMPRANCCFWTKAALRALWCWIDGLDPDGANALDPIDYDRCSPSPSVQLLYPEPGPGCETSGMCPVEAVDDGGDSAFPAIYADILVPRCSGSVCHDRAMAGGLDFSDEDRAFATVSARVMPGDPERSLLFQRISPDLCTGACQTMPLGRPVLPEDERDRIRAWIEAGAARD